MGPTPQGQSSSSRPNDCREWRQCQQLALEARERGEYERFHDLAWRTVQTGPARDPMLMYLLSRAQSLSGRPHDALVMLNRLADMGVPTDAATNDDFRAVRTLPDWPTAGSASHSGCRAIFTCSRTRANGREQLDARNGAELAGTLKNRGRTLLFGSARTRRIGLRRRVRTLRRWRSPGKKAGRSRRAVAPRSRSGTSSIRRLLSDHRN